MTKVLANVRRISELGMLGEQLAAEALASYGFENVRNLNLDIRNHPFADLIAEKGGTRYLIGVKTRNEDRDVGGLNPSYNCFTVAGPMSRRLKESGLSVDDITRLALDEIFAMAARYDAVAAWLTVPVRPLEQSYAAYFGFVSELGNRRSIPMTLAARDQHICLADWTMDERISPRLTNRKNDVLA